MVEEPSNFVYLVGMNKTSLVNQGGFRFLKNVQGQQIFNLQTEWDSFPNLLPFNNSY
jgi:hypothetical protein